MNQVLEVGQFQPSSSSQAEWEEFLTLRPVMALCAYVTRTQPLRKSYSHLFVCYGKAKLGLPLCKQCLSHRLFDVISHAEQGFPVLTGIRVHSARSVATTLTEVPLGDICTVASWSTSCTFAKLMTCSRSVSTAVQKSVSQRVSDS